MSHARLAPSAAHRWMACPGSVALCEFLPNTESDYADEGTAAHTVAAELLLSGALASSQIGREITVTRSTGETRVFPFTPEMAQHIQAYVNYVKELVLLEDADLLVEQKVTVIPNQVWGTSDALAVSFSRGVLHVIDLKFGQGVLVPAEGNEQLAIYALGALNRLFTHSPTKEARIQTISMHIVQPRRPDNDGRVARTWTITRAELEQFGKLVRDAVDATTAPMAPLVPGDQCRFCPASKTCPKLREVALLGAQAVFPDLDATKPVTPPAPETLSLNDLSRVLQAADIVETWLAAVRKHAFERACKGEQIAGMKLVQKVGNRRWLSETEAAAAITARGANPYVQELISPAQVEKLLGKKASAFVAALTERPVTGIALVPEKDKRPALESAQAFPFLDLDAEGS